MAEPRQEHCHPLNWTCGAPAGCHGYSCRASLLPPQIASTGVANEMRNYDFQNDYLPAIICGIIMMINALWRSDGCNSGADRSLSLLSLHRKLAGMWTQMSGRFSVLTPASSVVRHRGQGCAETKRCAFHKVSLAVCYCGNQAHLPAIQQRQQAATAMTSYFVALLC